MNPYHSNALPAGTQLMIVATLIIFAVSLYVACLYLRTLSRAVRACSEKNRAIEPGDVWLMLIPFFNIVYSYIVVNRVADSLKSEYKRQRYDDTQGFGRGVGLAFLICNQVAALFALSVLIVPSPLALVGNLLSLAALVCWIVHWVQIAGYSRVLRASRAFERERRARRMVMA